MTDRCAAADDDDDGEQVSGEWETEGSHAQPETENKMTGEYIVPMV